jgi:hypothetical protein
MSDLFLSLLNRIVLILIRFNVEIKVKGRNNNCVQFNSLNSLVDSHFDQICEPNHPCKESLNIALQNMLLHNKIIIIETGSSAWGTNSSELFNKFLHFKNNVPSNEAFLYTCDLRLNPLFNLIDKVSQNSYLICNDSVKFIENLSNKIPIDDFNFLIYLDSYDLDYRNPLPSGVHGFREFAASIPFLKRGTVLVIDDSPIDLNECPEYAKEDSRIFFENHGYYPGKGMFVDPIISKFKNCKKIFHKYQIVYLIE